MLLYEPVYIAPGRPPYAQPQPGFRHVLTNHSSKTAVLAAVVTPPTPMA